MLRLAPKEKRDPKHPTGPFRIVSNDCLGWRVVNDLDADFPLWFIGSERAYADREVERANEKYWKVKEYEEKLKAAQMSIAEQHCMGMDGGLLFEKLEKGEGI